MRIQQEELDSGGAMRMVHGDGVMMHNLIGQEIQCTAPIARLS